MKIKQKDFILSDDEMLLHVSTHPHLARDIEIFYKGKKVTYCTGIIISKTLITKPLEEKK